VARDGARHRFYSSPPALSPAATSPFPSGPLTGETRTRHATVCSITITKRSEEGLADVAEMTGEARVIVLDRRWPGDLAGRSGDLLDVVFGWADFARLRRLL
jgi:hypothetical protein